MALKCFKLLLHKTYFDKGWSLLNYIKYLIAFFGLASRDVKTTIIIGLVYGLVCYVVGMLWYKYKLIETETEIGNIFNPFVKEMRKTYKTEKFK